MHLSVPLRKASEAVAKTAGKSVATTGSNDLAAAPRRRMALTEPRSVRPEEAPFIIPPRTSSTETMMPWNGWISRFAKNAIGEKYWEKLREAVLFDKDDPWDLHQMPTPNTKNPISKTDPTLTHMYRTPSPGSQTAVRIPHAPLDNDPYDAAHFKRDTRRRYLNHEMGNSKVERTKVLLMENSMDKTDVSDELERVDAGPQSSPGNKGRFATGPTDFDSTGLRAAMSANWPETEKSLDKNMPNHLPTPTWMSRQEEERKWYEDRDLHMPLGAPYEGLIVPRSRRVFMW